MRKEIEERIDGLEKAAGILEDHLGKFAHMMQPKPKDFIANQIKNLNREIRIRRDYPS